MANERLTAAIESAQRGTTGRLKIYAKTMRGDEEGVQGRDRHAESRYKRRWEEGRVCVTSYLPPELVDAIDERCGPLVPGKSRIPRQHSRAYMVELLLYQMLVDPNVTKLPKRRRKNAVQKEEACV
jgi:hypothetical protein